MSLEKETIGFWERLMKFQEKHGYWKMTKLVLFVAFSITALFLAKNFAENFSFEKQKEVIEEVLNKNHQELSIQHDEEMKVRKQIKPLISNILKATITDMEADRAFIIELHNGSNNTTGLPFIHCTMTYEENAKDIESIDEDYQNLSLTRFSFPDYLHTHDMWMGDIEDFKEIDKKVTSRMIHNDVTFLVITTIRSENNEIGYFGFTYCNGKEHKTNKEIMQYVIGVVQKLSKILDKEVQIDYNELM